MLFFCALLLLNAPVANEPPNLWQRKQGEDWPQLLGPRQDNKSSEKLDIDWSQDLKEVWSFTSGEGYAMPTTSAGRLFLFDRVGAKARLTCFQAETGKQLWRQEYSTNYVDMYGFSNGPRIAPVIDGDRVYTYGSEGRLRCHSVVNGKLLWEMDTAKTFGVVQNFFGVGASPLVYNDLLIVQIGGSPEGESQRISVNTRANGTAYVAFDKRTGKEVYRIGDDLASYANPVVRRYQGQDWAFGFGRGGLLVFSPKDGTRKGYFPWRARRLESVNAATPVVSEDLVLITESYGKGTTLLRFGNNGLDVVRQDKPRANTLGAHWATPVLHEGFLYGSHGMGGSSDLRCVNFKTGEVRWTKRIRHAVPLYLDGHLLIGSERGDLRVIAADPNQYSEKVHKKGLVDSPAYNGPIVSHGYLYLMGDKRLRCFDLMAAAKK